MNIGVVGLGRMGAAIAERAVEGGFAVMGFDPNEETLKAAVELGVTPADDLSNMAEHCEVIWLMVPAGDVVDDVLRSLDPFLRNGVIVIDGGNSHFPDTVRRHKQLADKNIRYVDCGVSGGIKGREIGFSIMVGGDQEAFTTIEPLLKALAAPDGYSYLGPSGAGHYVKMVHNGIEYALLQSYAEGLHVLHDGKYRDLDLAAVTKVWQNGSVIRSWIVDLLHEIVSEDPSLTDISGHIEENKTGRWTLVEAEEQHVPTKLIEDALNIRSWSRETGGNYGTKLVAMLRNKFGGHAVKKNRT